MAILCQERTTATSRRSAGRVSRVNSVSNSSHDVGNVTKFCVRFDLHLDARLEYLTLAVANAKSHPISVGGRHETAIAFLTDLEEKLDVAQVQLEIYSTLLPHVNDGPAVGERINSLAKQLFVMTDVRDCRTLMLV